MKHIKSFLLLLFILGFQNTYAQYYWVGNSGPWSDFAHHWATTSGGTIFHDKGPSRDDDVYFDENSFTIENQTVVLDIATEVKAMTWNTSHQPHFDAKKNNLFIFGSILLQPDATYNFRSLYFRSSQEGETISTNNVDLGSDIRLDIGANGGYLLQNDISITTFQHSKGNFDTNGYDIDVAGVVYLSGSATGDINLGNSTISCYNWTDYGSNAILNAGTSTIHIAGYLRLGFDNFTTFQYNNLVLHNAVAIDGKGVFNNIEIEINEPEAVLTFTDGAILKCNQLSTNSSRALPLSMICNSETGNGTIEQAIGEVNIAYLTLENIHATGGATFNANPGVDNGNNIGWIFTEISASDYYWVENSGDWTDLSHWATQSGGAEKYTSLPTKFDNIIFDANSISMDNQQIHIDTTIVVNNFSTENITHNPKIRSENQYEVVVNGNLNWEGLIPSIPKLYLKTTGEVTMKFPSVKGIGYINLEDGGIYQLQSDVICTYLNLNFGTFISNDFSINAKSGLLFRTTSPTKSTVNLGSSQIFSEVFQVNTYSGPVDITMTTATIHATRKFYGGNKSYHHVILDKNITIKGSNTFNTLEFRPGTTAKFEAGKTQTIINEIIANGTSNQFISIKSSLNGTQYTWTKTTGDVLVKYMNIQDNIAIGGASFTASRSVDQGNNVGWNIEAPESRDFFWVGNGGDWSDLNHWATTSGGNNYYDELPGQIDNVFFDAQSFSNTNQKISVNQDVTINNLDWTEVSNLPLFDFNSGKLNIYGSCLLSDKMESQINQLIFLGSEDHIITADKNDNIGDEAQLYMESNGVLSINSDLKASKLYFKKGTINTNSHHVTISDKTTFLEASPKTMNLENSIYTSPKFSWQSYGDSLTINGQNGTIICSKDFQLDHISVQRSLDVHLKKIHFIDANSVSKIQASFQVDTLIIDAGKEIQIVPESEITVQDLVANGTENAHIYIHSTENQIKATIHKSQGTVECEYLELKDIEGAGGATFTAYYSTDLGNVKGWNFIILSTDQHKYKEVNITPNPAKTYVHIDLPNGQSGQYEIYNLLGKLVQKSNFKGQERLQIDIESFESGLYLIVGEAGDKNFKGKIIKD